MSNNQNFLEGVKIFGKKGFWDINIEGSKFFSIKNSLKSGGGLITPRFADIHVHLDKTGTSKRLKRRATSLFDAIELMNDDKKKWTENDVYFRANQAIKNSFNCGTKFIRTHVDWETKKVPLAWEVLKNIKSEFKDSLEIQIASLCPLDLLYEEGNQIAKVIKNDNAVLGSFVYCNDNLKEKIKFVFELAIKYDLNLDFHVDEGLEKEATGIDYIVHSSKKLGLQKKVLCGHGCSLSIRNSKVVLDILRKMSDAQVGLTCLPTTNFWLQDNVEERTPRLRGIAPIKEARNAGVSIMIASDNCKDAFYPFGNYNVLSVYKIAVLAGHLDENKWFDSITSIPSKWMGYDNEIKKGSEASFLKFSEGSICDIIENSNIKYQVWQKGKVAYSSN